MKKSIYTFGAALAVVAAAGCASNPSGIKNDAERDAIRSEIMARVNAYASDEANADCAYADPEVEKYFKGVREIKQLGDLQSLRYEYVSEDGTTYVNTFKRDGKYSQSQTKNGKTTTVIYNNGKAVVKSADGKTTPVDNANFTASLRFVYDITMNPLKMAASADIPMRDFAENGGRQKIESLVNGRLCNTVKLKLKSMYNTDAVTYYISADDNSIIKKKYAPSKSEANNGVEIVYSEFADNGGFYAPKKVVNTISGKANTLTLKSVTKNLEIPDDFFKIAE